MRTSGIVGWFNLRELNHRLNHTPQGSWVSLNHWATLWLNLTQIPAFIEVMCQISVLTPWSKWNCFIDCICQNESAPPVKFVNEIVKLLCPLWGSTSSTGSGSVELHWMLLTSGVTYHWPNGVLNQPVISFDGAM